MNRSSIQLVIPAAGNGIRFKQAGYSKIKPLIEVHGIPMINWVIANFDLNENDRVFIIVKNGDRIEELRENWFKVSNLKLNFIVLNGITEGPADSVNKVRKLIDGEKPMIVANSDQFVNSRLRHFVDEVCHSSNVGSILTMYASGEKWSYIEASSNGTVNKVVEKVELSDQATVGIYGWKKAMHFFDSFNEMKQANDRTNNEFYVAPTYNYLINRGLNVSYINIGNLEDTVFGLGTPEDLEFFLQNKESARLAQTIKHSLR